MLYLYFKIRSNIFWETRQNCPFYRVILRFPFSNDLNKSTTLKKFWSSLSRHCINQLKQLVRNCITENSPHATLSHLLLPEMHLSQFTNFQESPWNNVFRKHRCIYIRLLKRRHCTDTLTTLTAYRIKWSLVQKVHFDSLNPIHLILYIVLPQILFATRITLQDEDGNDTMDKFLR